MDKVAYPCKPRPVRWAHPKYKQAYWDEIDRHLRSGISEVIAITECVYNIRRPDVISRVKEILNELENHGDKETV